VKMKTIPVLKIPLPGCVSVNYFLPETLYSLVISELQLLEVNTNNSNQSFSLNQI